MLKKVCFVFESGRSSEIEDRSAQYRLSGSNSLWLEDILLLSEKFTNVEPKYSPTIMGELITHTVTLQTSARIDDEWRL